MGLLSKATSGTITLPEFMVIHGVDGVGKSTFAAKFPAPFFIGPEQGTAKLNVTRLPTGSWTETKTVVAELVNDQHKFETLVIDSLDWLEGQLFSDICRERQSANIELVDGGYGKGYVEAVRIWRDFIGQLSVLRDKRKMHIVLIAHSHIKAFNDPQTNTTYDRYIIKLNEKAAALWREAADNVLFANYEVMTKEEKSKKTKAFGDGTRLLFTERRPAFDAKNRDGLPFQMALDYDAYLEAKMKGMPDSAEQIGHDVAELFKMLPNVTKDDKALRNKVEKHVGEVSNNVTALLAVRNRLRTMLGQN